MKKLLLCIVMISSVINATNRTTAPVFESTKIAGMGNANISFVDDQDAIYYNSAAMDILDKNFHLSIAQTGIVIDNNFIGFLSLILANTSNLKKFANDIETINSDFAKSVSPYDQEWMKIQAQSDFDFTIKQFGLGAWSKATVSTYYDDGIFIPEPKLKNEIEASAHISFGYRILKTLSIGITPKYWIRISDTITVPITKENLSSTGNESDGFSVLDSTNKFGRIADGIDSPFDYAHISSDLGLIYHMGNMRVAAVFRDFFETALGNDLSGEDVRMRMDLGFGYRYTYLEKMFDIKSITLTTELHDLFDDRNFFTKIHSGAEINLYPFMARGGISSGYFTYGFTLQFIGVRFDFASFAEEGSSVPGLDEIRSYKFNLKFGI